MKLTLQSHWSEYRHDLQRAISSWPAFQLPPEYPGRRLPVVPSFGAFNPTKFKLPSNIDFCWDIEILSLSAEDFTDIATSGEQMRQSGRILADHVAMATFKAPSSIIIRFADGLASTISLADLGLNASEFLFDTLRVAKSGTAIEMKTKTRKGKFIPIDAASLRYLADPEYAAGIDAQIRELRMPFDEAKAMARSSEERLDPRWHEVDDSDLLK